MRGDGRVFQRGPRWWISYYALDRDTGKRKEIRESGGATEKEAGKLLQQRRDEVATAKSVGRPFLGPVAERVTVNELLKALENYYVTKGKKSLPQLKSRIKRIREKFGTYRAIAVTPIRVDAYIVERQSEEARPATINREIEVLQRAFTLAVEKQRLAYVPKFASLAETDNAREGFFEKADFGAVLDQIDDPDVADFLRWFYFTGMRPGEIKSLTWRAFDRETWTVRLPAKDAKTGKARKLGLEGELRPIFERRLERRQLHCPFIFHRGGERMGEFRKTWRTACEEAGVEGMLVYDLRRTAIRNMVRAGVPENVAMRISGHRTRNVFDRYDITSDEDIRQAMERTSEYVSSLPTKRKIAPMKARKAAKKEGSK